MEREETVAEAAGDKGYTREDLVNDILATYFPSTTKPSLILKTLQNAIKSTLQDKDYSDDPYAQKLLTQLKVNPVFGLIRSPEGANHVQPLRGCPPTNPKTGRALKVRR